MIIIFYEILVLTGFSHPKKYSHFNGIEPVFPGMETAMKSLEYFIIKARISSVMTQESLCESSFLMNSVLFG